MANEATIEVAREIRMSHASDALTQRQAKLYSQRLRRDMGRDGLASFLSTDIDVYLDEAMLLIQCGLLERRANPASAWRDAVKRAAELLEWLSQSSLKPEGAPIHLLAAAAYQLAGYPAMALGHLRSVPDDQPFSVLLRELLRGNFPAALESVRMFWRSQRALGCADRVAPEDLASRVVQHVVACIGTLCTYLRTGEDVMVGRALAKLDSLADGMVHSRDPFSHLLAQLTAMSCRRFVETSIWRHVTRLRETSNESAGAALVQFARSSFVNNRSLVWPAQASGIARLGSGSSFVLCTPTGSGKTTVATIAIVQNLFSDPSDDPFGFEDLLPGNLILYLVPSRALAAEVENRLAQDLKGVAAEPVIVTGLYGGIDWGPTDAWIQADRATIVICTFEKADALVRYLGVLFLHRVRLVVIDEAHMVEQDRANLSAEEIGSSRALRLEQLGARLLRAQTDYGFRVLALSAVAARAAPALARWVTGEPDASPTTSSYRSTRQMLGRLEVSAGGQYAIRYDLMDGRSLKFDDESRGESPFVPNPFAQFPGGIDEGQGPEVRMRAPTLWAALQLAAERPDGSKPAVLISLTQNIEAFAATCADLIDGWPEGSLPNYRTFDEAGDLWARCLASAADYFSEQSVEYRLLNRGIAVHHGKMPALLARRLKAVIDRGLVRVIIATSTLSEGVNIPVNYLLIPSVCRGPGVLSLQEFTNLVGRAGRPGVATEGSALVVLPERTIRRGRFVSSRQWGGYLGLVADIERTAAEAEENIPEDHASSPLAQLLGALGAAWHELTPAGTHEDFMSWLERTAILGDEVELGEAAQYLDSLDAFLIAAIQELEELKASELEPDRIEMELAAVWRRTYAFAASQEEARLAATWLARGRAIKTLYPNAHYRRRIYRTSLLPRSAIRLLDIAEGIRDMLRNGAPYAYWTQEERFLFIRNVLGSLSQVPSFQIGTTLGRGKNFGDWPTLLRWWLAKNTLAAQPKPKEITAWYDFVAKNFIYRGAWGLGSVIGVLLEGEEGGEPIRALEIGDWPRSGLPWIAFWLKELITWGTLDPVAAFLLARGGAVDRRQAEADAAAYYESLPQEIDPNDALDPRVVREWVNAQRVRPDQEAELRQFNIEATLVRPADQYSRPRLTVYPLEANDGLLWIDPAGYTVARSERPDFLSEQATNFEFILDVENAKIDGNLFQRYR